MHGRTWNGINHALTYRRTYLSHGMAGQTQSLAESQYTQWLAFSSYCFSNGNCQKQKCKTWKFSVYVKYCMIRFITRPSSGLYAVYCAYSPQCQVTSEPFSLTRTDRAAL